MMNKPLDQEILDTARAYCDGKALSSFLLGLGKSEKVEERMLGGRKTAGSKTHAPAAPLSSPDKLDQLITFCQNTLPVQHGLQAVLDIGETLKRHGEHGRAVELYTLVLAQTNNTRHKRLRAEAFLRRGDAHGRQGRWKESTADLEESRRIFHSVGDQEGVARVQNLFGTNYAEQGMLKHAETNLQKALATFERSGQRLSASSLMVNLGILFTMTANYDKALLQFQRARSNFETAGDADRLGSLHHNIGMTLLAKSAHEAALKEFDKSFALGSESHNVGLMGLANLGKANVYYQLGDLRAALKLLNEALDLFVKSNDRLSIADGYKVKGMIHREMKKYDFAESYLKTSLRINTELNNRLNIAETYFELGLLDKRRGKRDTAIASLNKARSCFKRIGVYPGAARANDEIHSLRKKPQ
jgi:tetratricopeptide (TPR) repeat protein